MTTAAEVQTVSDSEGNAIAVIVPIDVWREVESERETAYLLSSETNKKRLLAAIARDGEGAISLEGNGHEVEDFLRERREEVERDNAQGSTPMPREQFDARLEALRERTLQGQAAKRASREQAQQQARAA